MTLYLLDAISTITAIALEILTMIGLKSVPIAIFIGFSQGGHYGASVLILFLAHQRYHAVYYMNEEYTTWRLGFNIFKVSNSRHIAEMKECLQSLVL